VSEEQTTDTMAEKLLVELREQLVTARKTANQEPWETQEDGFGRAGWTAKAARDGLHSIKCFRGWGADWVASQPETIQREIDAAESELLEMKGQAILDGAVELPNDVPADPSGP
jgi:hypothetical protein